MAEEATTTTGDTTTAAPGAAAATDATGVAQAAPAAADAGQTTDTKPAETKPAEAKPAEVKAEPVDYTKAISEAQMPEGYTLDPALAKAGGEMFAKHAISADAAKELTNFFAQQQKAGADGNAKAFAAQVDGWKAAAEKATTPEERSAAKDAALKVFGKEEMTLLDTFGVTNRAGFIKALATIGKAMKDDVFVPGNAVAVNGAPDARKHFPNSNMNP